MKRFTITSITLCVAAFWLGACIPLLTASGPAAPAGAWQTYSDAEVGFSIQYPPTWTSEPLPDQNDGAIHGTAFAGPEGGVEVYWGIGFGGACPEGTEPVQLAQGEAQACHATTPVGTDVWSQIGYQVEGGNDFSVRAYTSNAEPSSHDLVLQVLATLAFMAPEQPKTTAGLANPASENCIALGGALTFEDRGDGGQFGVCTFADDMQSPAGDGSQCEEWALMRGDCPVGGVKVTDYATPAGRYCAITGGTYAVTGNSGQADEQGTCTLPGGVQCDAAEFYDGKCDASTGKMPNTSGLTLAPPIAEVCNGMAQALAEALSRANTQHAIVEVTHPAEPVSMTDPLTGAEGTACRAQAAGTGEDFASPDAIMNALSAVLTGGGWQEDKQSMGAGGPTGEGWGFRSGDLVAMALAAWLPDPAANCPNDQPIPECKLTPSQQLYTITLDTAQTVKQTPVVQGVQPAPAPKSNPAATNCINVGGTPKTETRPDGGQYGVCYFGDNYVCEQWALLHGECPVGGVKVTGYNTPAARYCAITGGEYIVIGTTNTGQEAGSCTLPSGKVCDADEYYAGTCSSSSPEPGPPTAVPPIGKPNPASQYCTSVGGTLKIEQRDDVGQIGVCYFADNRQCEEWALEEGYCPVGGVKVTGYNTPAARFCAITGGSYTPTGMTPDGQEDGNCVLPNGEVCGAWQYYNGYCGTP